MNRIPVAILGASGMVGQRFVQRLADHPWFRIETLVGKDSLHQVYGKLPWRLEGRVPEAAADLRVEGLDALKGPDAPRIVFSALPGGVAGPIETRLAAQGSRVFTNARDHRMDPLVPLLVPEINPGHIALLDQQPGPGSIVANGNCSSIILELPLAALHRGLGVASCDVVTMQSLSGAGHPGVSALDIMENLVPYIAGEEEKVEREPLKTLGTLTPQGLAPADIAIRATCTRVPVREGHTLAAHLRLQRAASLEEVQQALRRFQGSPEVRALPSAPRHPIHVLEDADRPQPRLDRDLEAGMAVSVGRIRVAADGLGVRLVALGHNTVRGAAGQSVLNAEFALASGYLDRTLSTKLASMRGP